MLGPPYEQEERLAGKIREGSTRLARIEMDVDNPCVRASSEDDLSIQNAGGDAEWPPPATGLQDGLPPNGDRSSNPELPETPYPFLLK